MKKKIIGALGLTLMSMAIINMAQTDQIKADSIDETVTSSETTSQSSSSSDTTELPEEEAEAVPKETPPLIKAAPLATNEALEGQHRANIRADWEEIDKIEEGIIAVEGTTNEKIKYQFGSRTQLNKKISDLQANTGSLVGQTLFQAVTIPNVFYGYQSKNASNQTIEKNMGTTWGSQYSASTTSPGIIVAQGTSANATGDDISTNVVLADYSKPVHLYKRVLQNGLMEYKLLFSGYYHKKGPSGFAPEVTVEKRIWGQTDGIVNHSVAVKNVDSKGYDNFVLGNATDIEMSVVEEQATSRSTRAGTSADKVPFYFSEDGNGIYMSLKDVETTGSVGNIDNKDFKLYYYFDGLNQGMTGPDNWVGGVHDDEFKPYTDSVNSATYKYFYGDYPLVVGSNSKVTSLTDFYNLNDAGQETRVVPNGKASVYDDADSEISMKNQSTTFISGETLTIDYQVGLKAQSNVPVIKWDQNTYTVEPNTPGDLTLKGKWSEISKDTVDLFFNLNGAQHSQQLDINNPNKGNDTPYTVKIPNSSLKFGPNEVKGEISNKVSGISKGSATTTVNLKGTLNIVYQDDKGVVLPSSVVAPKKETGLKDEKIPVVAPDLTSKHYEFVEMQLPAGGTSSNQTTEVAVAQADQTVKVIYKAIPQTVTQTIEYVTPSGNKLYDVSDPSGNTLIDNKTDTVKIGDIIKDVTTKVDGYVFKEIKDDEANGFYVPGPTKQVPDKNFVIRVICDPILSLKVPDTLDFGEHKLLVSGSRDIQPTTAYKAVVTDTRDKEMDKQWQVSLRVKTPMQLEGSPGSLFNGAIKFKRKDGSKQVVSLTDQANLVHQRETKAVGDQEVTWNTAAGEGLFLEQKPGNSKGAYKTVLEWNVVIDGF